MTRLHRLVVCSTVAALLLAGVAGACTIVDKRPARLGVEKGVEGRCANNGERIICTLSDEGEGITCSGPAGDFSSDNMVQLVRSACGCPGPQQAPQTLEQQLENYP